MSSSVGYLYTSIPVSTCRAAAHLSRSPYLAVDRDTFNGPISHVDLGAARPGTVHCHAGVGRSDDGRTNVLATVHYHRRWCETIPRRALQSRLNGEISNSATCNCHVRRTHDHVRTTAVTNCPHSFRCRACCLILRVDLVLYRRPFGRHICR